MANKKPDLSNMEKRVLLALEHKGEGTPEQIVREAGFKREVEVMNAASWLKVKGLVELDESATKAYTLFRQRYASKGFAERRALRELDKAGGRMTLTDLSRSGTLEEFELPIATGWLKRKGWVELRKDGSETVLEITTEGRNAVHKQGLDEETVKRLSEGELLEEQIDSIVLKQLKSRKDVLKERDVVCWTIRLTQAGRDLLKEGVVLGKDVGQLTPKMLLDDSWQTSDFRRYDVHSFATKASPGRRHPMKAMGDRVRDIFLSMGFTEIETGYVQSAFMNMDMLFTAQDHPARDLHDTFYLSNPAKLPLPDEKLVQTIKGVHENGGDTGSSGWGYQWSRSEAERAMLRTHTTVNTITHLWKNPVPPCRVFSVGRVFRNEAIDSTHLPEFTQVEGIVYEEGANFAMLTGMLREFLAKLGFPKIRMRPGYFPYTEPSLEIDIFYNGDWMELAGAGIFRPEVTRPHGITQPVLAWGFGLERLAIVLTGAKDLRDLYISDVDWLRESKLI